MRLVDVNVLVYAFRQDAPRHEAHREWLARIVTADEPYAVSDHVLAGFLRVVTHPRVFDPPTPLEPALEFADAYRTRPNAVSIQPGLRHWGIFMRICLESSASGNLIPDAWLAALALEHGCELVSTDADFARFQGLRWRRPLE